MRKIRYTAIVFLFILPFLLIFADIYGINVLRSRKKYSSDSRFKNLAKDFQQEEGEEYLSIWEKWNQMQDGQSVNITGEWKLALGYITEDYEGPVSITIVLWQNGEKLRGKLFSGRRFESVSFLSGKVSGDRFCAICDTGMETGYLAALVKEDKMDGFIVRRRHDGLMRVDKWTAQRIKSDFSPDRSVLFLKGRYFYDLTL